MASDDLRADALDYLTSAETAALAVTDLHKAFQASRDAGRPATAAEAAKRRVGEANHAIETALRMAEISALLYIGDALAEIVGELQLPAGRSLPGATEPLVCVYCARVADIGSEVCAEHA